MLTTHPPPHTHHTLTDLSSVVIIQPHRMRLSINGGHFVGEVSRWVDRDKIWKWQIWSWELDKQAKYRINHLWTSCPTHKSLQWAPAALHPAGTRTQSELGTPGNRNVTRLRLVHSWDNKRLDVIYWRQHSFWKISTLSRNQNNLISLKNLQNRLRFAYCSTDYSCIVQLACRIFASW